VEDESAAGTARVTQLLRQWGDGDQRACDALVPIVYDTLRRLAERHLADERHAQTLQPTALVHEAYLRLVAQDTPDWESRAHFYGVAAHLMRQVLVDHARRRLSAKRGAGAVKLELKDVAEVPAPGQPVEIFALNEALDELARVDERKCRIIELRYFGGCTEEETARSMAVSIATVRRDLRTAEAWLAVKLNPGE
jgi:RNA polymerase sigma factor (TIGR02999 family)